MSQLPGAANATIPNDKITQYLLNPNHPDGKAKARFFGMFGISQANWGDLWKALGNHPLTNPVTRHTVTSYGETYEVSCSLTTPDGRNPCIISVWIVEPNDPNPRLVTAYANPP
jgi:hypothetical protein